MAKNEYLANLYRQAIIKRQEELRWARKEMEKYQGKANLHNFMAKIENLELEITDYQARLQAMNYSQPKTQPRTQTPPRKNTVPIARKQNFVRRSPFI